MFERIAKYFGRGPNPTEPFVDDQLGEFVFVRAIGWQKKVMLEGRIVNLLLGSDGEWPSPQMRDTAVYWLANFERRRPEFNDVIRAEIQTWPTEELLFFPEDLKLQSIEILWPNRSTVCMIYFELNDDDYRQFHLTFDGPEFRGFAYDD